MKKKGEGAKHYQQQEKKRKWTKLLVTLITIVVFAMAKTIFEITCAKGMFKCGPQTPKTMSLGS